MAAELVFTVDGQTAQAASPITMAEAGFKERQHLQEWVLANPAILGPGVFVVTSEFDRWTSKAGAEKDRLDVLGLDKEGRLVVAELKRDAAPETVEMQAIKYAAMASRFDIDVLADAHADFVRRSGREPLTSEEAAEVLANVTALAALDVCSERPDEWVPFEDVIARSGREPAKARGDTGGLTLTIRARFGRSNWPYEAKWAAGGKQQIYYRMTTNQANMWQAARAALPQTPVAADTIDSDAADSAAPDRSNNPTDK